MIDKGSPSCTVYLLGPGIVVESLHVARRSEFGKDSHLKEEKGRLITLFLDIWVALGKENVSFIEEDPLPGFGML